MELRRLSLCIAVVVLAVFAHCSEARQTRLRRDTEDVNYDDALLADEAGEDEAQNDDGGNDDDDEPVVNATILTKPANYNISIGLSVQLDCDVWPRDGAVVVTWLKDGKIYFLGGAHMEAPQRFSIVSGKSDLLIRDSKPEDSGTYTCQVMQNNTILINHTLVVVEAPRIIRFTASSTTPKEGDDLLLTCDAAGSPRPSVVWTRFKDGANVRLSESDGEFSSNTFFARKVTRKMSGTYYCYALNKINKSGQLSLDIDVVAKPRVHAHRTIVNSDIGVEAILQCTVHDEPEGVSIRWLKDGKLIESSQYFVNTTYRASALTVTPMADEDFGTFTCEAKNKHGIHNRSIELVQSPVVDGIDVDGQKLTWIVHSHQPLQDMEVQLRSLQGDGEWITIKVPLPTMGTEKKHDYEISYILEDKQLSPGKYEAIVKVRNGKSWSAHSEPTVIDIDTQAQPIQTASVFRGNAHSIRPAATAVLSTTLMYLLVRMI